jgi:predicted dehydrogenase
MTKVIVVGTGFGCLVHVPALRRAGFEVAALVGRVPERTRARADRMDIAEAHTDLATALALPGVEAVVVSTPPHTHAKLVGQALAAGRHVLCEKPFAADGAEARTMLTAAEQAGVVHMVGTEFRFATGQALAQRAVAAGVIGEPRMATFMLHIPMLAGSEGEVPTWWGDAGSGGGWLGAHASHAIDQMLELVGPFTGVSAALPRLSDREWTAEDSYSIHFRTSTGAVGILQSTAAAWGPFVFLTRLAGTEGTLWVEGDTVNVADANGERVLDTPDDLVLPPGEPPPADMLITTYDHLHSTGMELSPATRMHETFRARIEGRDVSDDPRPATFADGVAVMDVLDAIRRSDQTGSWVEITADGAAGGASHGT